MQVTVARLSRSAWKGPYIVPMDLSQKIIRTQARACTIIPSFVGHKFQVHNGKDYILVDITEEHVGHKLGEFAPTRKRFSYRQTKNK